MNTSKCNVFVTVTDSQAQAVPKAVVTLVSANGTVSLPATDTPGSYAASGVSPGEWTLSVTARGYNREELRSPLSPGRQSININLGKPGESYYYANRSKVYFQADTQSTIVKFAATVSEAEIVNVLKSHKISLAPTTAGTRSGIENGRGSFRMVLTGPDTVRGLQDKLAPEHGYAIPLRQGKTLLGGLTTDLVISFGREASKTEAESLAKSIGMTVLRAFNALQGGFVLRALKPDLKILEHSRSLIEERGMAVAEPDLLLDFELDAYTPNDLLYPQQRHLPLIDANDAWELLGNYDPTLRGGSPTVCIAVFDPDGVHPSHPDLTAALSDGTQKMIANFNFTSMTPQTVPGLGGNHGTQCAGSATAAFDNGIGIAGVAPNCHLIGARINGLTQATLADAYLWAAGIDNGNTSIGWPALPSRPADVISNSWGQSNAALSATLQACFDRLTNEGRDRKGVLVTFSVGNLGHVQFSNIRRWAAYERNIAVGASINSSPTSPTNSDVPTPAGATTNITVVMDTRALYSPYGPEMDIVAPSHTTYLTGNLVDPIISSVRVGQGNLDGCPGAQTCNDYAASFGGTSHSSPTIAGTCALILSANPLLTWREAMDIIRRTAVKIDFAQTNTIGQYQDVNGDGVREFSNWYGYGRVNVLEAVRDALNLWVAQRVTLDDVNLA